mgnify:CR=1 FL=1
MNYETVIGIEIHCELKTKTKMFSGAPVAFGKVANTCVNEIDLGHPGPYRVAELLDKPFFLTERNANYRRTFDKFLASHQVELTPSLEISDTAFIIKMLEHSSGISLLPRFAVAESAAKGQLRILEVSDFQLTMYRQMFYHKDKCCTREMKAFIQLADGPDIPL